MWGVGDQNVKFKGQMTGYGPASTEVTYVEKRNFLHSTGRSDKPFLAESSGKGENNSCVGNKISDDVPSFYRGKFGDNMQDVSGEMISQHTLHMAKTQQGVTFTDKDAQSAEANIMLPQYGGYQFHDPNSLPSSLQTKGVNFQKPGLNNLQSILHRTEPSPQSNTSIREYPQLPNSQHLSYGLSSQADAGKFLSYANEGAVSREKVQADFKSTDVINLAIRNFPPLNNSCFGSISAPHGSERSSEFSWSGMCKTELGNHEAKFGGRNFCGNVCYVGTSTEAVKNGYNVDMTGISNVILNMTAPTQTSTVMERNKARSCYYPKIEGQSSYYLWGNAGASFNGKDQENNESGTWEKPSDSKTTLLDYARLNESSNEAHFSKNADGSDGGNVNNSLKEEASSIKGFSVNKPAAPHEKNPLCMVSTSKPSIKVAPRITEKLWDGTLQLNTSTVVSVVAVFKSGEKVSEVNWSKFVEIKGKVRLEAFEKFLQELPRSRTRALMVISIYWKVGSSETGLMGMKEVAKGYKEGQRVGYAQLCPGIDLYICPHSDAIITILAKYGFFKGMAAVEEDQDSLVGCVIWRRNHPSSDFFFKKSDKNEFPLLEQPLDSPESGVSNTADQNSLVTKTTDFRSNQVTPGLKVPSGSTSPLKPSAPGNGNTDEIKKIKSTNVSINVISKNNNAAPVLTPLPTHISSLNPQLSMSVQTMDMPAQDVRKCTSPITTPFGHYEAQKKPQVGLEPSLVVSGASQKLQDNDRRSADNDDDDLPEFDFGNAYGVLQVPDNRLPSSSHNHHPLQLPPHDQQLPVEVNKSPRTPRPLELPSVRQPPPNDALHRSHAPPYVGLIQNPKQKVSLSKEVGVPAYGGQPSAQTIEPSSALGGSETEKNLASQASKSFFPLKMVESFGPASKSGASEMQNSVSQAIKSSSMQRRPIWDDDDMPEWCPPNLDNRQLPPIPVPWPPLRPMPPTTSKQPAPSPFLAPPSASTPSWSSIPPPPHMPFPLQYDQNISHQHHSGILGHRPLDSNRKTPMETRPATRFGRSDWRASPESSKAKRQRRVSGWDVKPWEVKPDLQYGQSERY